MHVHVNVDVHVHIFARARVHEYDCCICTCNGCTVSSRSAIQNQGSPHKMCTVVLGQLHAAVRLAARLAELAPLHEHPALVSLQLLHEIVCYVDMYVVKKWKVNLICLFS